jgi:hypothetical protein
MFVVPPHRQAEVRAALADLPELHIDHEPQGSQLVVPFH